MSPERIRPGSARGGNRGSGATGDPLSAEAVGDEESGGVDEVVVEQLADDAESVEEKRATAPTSAPGVDRPRTADSWSAMGSDDSEVDQSAPVAKAQPPPADQPAPPADQAAPLVEPPAAEPEPPTAPPRRNAGRGPEPSAGYDAIQAAAAAQEAELAGTPQARRAEAMADSFEVDELAGDELIGSETFVLTGGPAAATHRGFFRRLYYGESRFDFVGRRRLWFVLSAVLILAGVVSLATRGLNLDIEFVGGTSWTVQWPAANVTEARNVLAPLNLSGSTITILGQPHSTQRSLQVEAKIPRGQSAHQTQDQLVRVEDTLARVAHVSANSVSIVSVGPSWGSVVTTKAVQALVVFFVLVAIYISLFFEWRMALAAIAAVIHDILVVVGIYSLTGFDVTPDTVVAILTILGYSLYDTIVVFDRIRDNLKGVGSGGRLTISDIVNLSMNQTLARSINTSFVAILPIFAVLILGAEVLGATTLQYFGWALLIGLASGAYSSIFIASPIVAMLKEKEPRWRRIRERLVQRGAEHQVLSPAALAAGLFAAEGGGAGASARRPARTTRKATPARATTSRPGAARQGGGRPAGGAAGRPGGGTRHKGGRR